MLADDLAQAVGGEAAQTLEKGLERIEHCLAQLSDDQVWDRALPALNSIGNVLLHLAGNVRQWIIAGIGGAADIRHRPSEFSERGPIPKAELLGRLSSVVGEASALLRQTSAAELLRQRRIQGFDVTGLGAVFDTVPHFRGHVQEIVFMTRLMLGDLYRFAWTPTTVEQGA